MEFLRRMVRKNSESKILGIGGKKDDQKVPWSINFFQSIT
jgi:hypothetical protein